MHARRRDEPRRARRGEEYVGLAAARGKVGRFPVAERHGRVCAREQQRRRTSDDEAAADDGHAPARGVKAIGAQQVQARLGRTGGKARRTRQQRAERRGRHAVDVLAGVERVKNALRAQRLRQRPQQQHAVHGVVHAQGAQRAGQGICRAVRRQVDRAHGHAAPVRRAGDAAQIGAVIRPRAHGHRRKTRLRAERGRLFAHLRIDLLCDRRTGQTFCHRSALPA